MPKLTQPGRAEMPQGQADAQPSNEHRIRLHLCATDRYPERCWSCPLRTSNTFTESWLKKQDRAMNASHSKHSIRILQRFLLSYSFSLKEKDRKQTADLWISFRHTVTKWEPGLLKTSLSMSMIKFQTLLYCGVRVFCSFMWLFYCCTTGYPRAEFSQQLLSYWFWGSEIWMVVAIHCSTITRFSVRRLKRFHKSGRFYSLSIYSFAGSNWLLSRRTLPKSWWGVTWHCLSSHRHVIKWSSGKHDFASNLRTQRELSLQFLVSIKSQLLPPTPLKRTTTQVCTPEEAQLILCLQRSPAKFSKSLHKKPCTVPSTQIIL